MPDLDAALAAGNLPILLWTAAALGLLHTLLGPDHYVPFAVMAKADGWSRKRTFVITTICGLGHVIGSVVIAVLLIMAGKVVADWEGSSWAGVHEVRGSIAAWLLMGVGAAIAVWGTVRAVRGQKHTHPHAHEGGEVHVHEHDHAREHAHAHGDRVKKLTPWILFTIFVFGPCESLIPLMLAAYADAGLGGAALIAGAFSLTTVVTILVSVAVLLGGFALIPTKKLERWTTTLAGVSLVFCGAGIQFLGL